MVVRAIMIGLAGLLALNGAGAETGDDAHAFFGIHATGQFFDIFGDSGNPDIGNTLLPGLQLGYQLNRHWSVQGWYERGGFEMEDRTGEGDARTVLLEGRRHFPDIELAGFAPYVGVSAQDFEVAPDNGRGDNEALAAVGFGLERKLGRRWRLDLGGRETWSFDEQRRDAQFYLGLSRRFGSIGGGPSSDLGGGAEAEGPGFKVKDSDGDGVADPMDDCPGTPVGTEVDGMGCAAGAGEGD